MIYKSIVETYRKLEVENNRQEKGEYKIRLDISDIKTDIPIFMGIDSSTDLIFCEVICQEKFLTLFVEQKTVGLEISKTRNSDNSIIRISLKQKEDINRFNLLIADALEVFTFNNSVKNSLTEFNEAIKRWISFLKKDTKKKLMKEEVIGLFGELIILKKLLELKQTGTLNFWKGPLGKTHDFINKSKSLEVKTTSNSLSKTIHISSEFQLDLAEQTYLHLVHIVLDEDLDHPEQMTLNSLVIQIKGMLSSNLQEQFSFLLYQVGFSEEDITKQKYSLNTINIYKVDELFPKIIPSDIHQNLSKVEYQLSLNGLDENRLNNHADIWQHFMDS